MSLPDKMEIKIKYLILEYEERGGLHKLPQIGTTIETEHGEATVIDVTPFCRYLDGGEKPFTVHLKVRL